MVALVFEGEGFNHVFAILDKVENPDWSDLLTQIGSQIQDQTTRHFVEERGPEGPWTPLAPSTVKAKGHATILTGKTGILKGSIQTDPRGAYAIAIGTSTTYGKYHQRGVSNSDGSVRTPQRMFLGMHDADAGEIETVLQNYINSYLGRD